MRHGVCICGRKQLRFFEAQVIGVFRVWLKKGNDLKLLIENNFCVIRLEFGELEDASDSDNGYWYHISFTNQHTWMLELLPMVGSNNAMLRRAARRLDHVALRCVPDHMHLEWSSPERACGIQGLMPILSDKDLTQKVYTVAQP